VQDLHSVEYLPRFTEDEMVCLSGIQWQRQLISPLPNVQLAKLLGRDQIRGFEGLVGEQQTKEKDVRAEDQ
jgi:hypothetical protein